MNGDISFRISCMIYKHTIERIFVKTILSGRHSSCLLFIFWININLLLLHELFKRQRYKWNLGLNIYDAYQKKDNKAILDIIEKQLVPAIERIDKVRLARQKEWNITNKIYGFEVFIFISLF